MIRIEPMTAEHIEQIYRIENLCFPKDPWSISTFELELGVSYATYIVATENGAVLGYAGMHHVLDVAEIVNIGVDPDFRGQKNGSKLIYELETRALKLGVTTINLDVRASNTAAIKLYKNHGFTPIAARKNYYRKPVEDAIVMQKIFSATEANHD
ncbi:MAG: ribosomal protein S18-alanine N-acetyltransferase [Defluviitaleaceae bacterium]|nr:ribosomal protein S18-alanine N-acetyltransferase [Defluviitaleaceae bacterium]